MMITTFGQDNAIVSQMREIDETIDRKQQETDKQHTAGKNRRHNKADADKDTFHFPLVCGTVHFQLEAWPSTR